MHILYISTCNALGTENEVQQIVQNVRIRAPSSVLLHSQPRSTNGGPRNRRNAVQRNAGQRNVRRKNAAHSNTGQRNAGPRNTEQRNARGANVSKNLILIANFLLFSYNKFCGTQLIKKMPFLCNKIKFYFLRNGCHIENIRGI